MSRPCHAAALKEIWRIPLNEVKAGLRGRPGWSSAQYRTVVLRLVETPHGAAIADDLYPELGTEEGAAEAVVRAMVKANMLGYLKLLPLSASNRALHQNQAALGLQSGQETSPWRPLAQTRRTWLLHPPPYTCTACVACRSAVLGRQLLR